MLHLWPWKEPHKVANASEYFGIYFFAFYFIRFFYLCVSIGACFFSAGTVIVLKDFKLMKYPHSANEAQNQFQINVKDVSFKINAS